MRSKITIPVLLLVALCTGLTFLPPVENEGAAAWLEFLGTIHPMVLHLPIGLWFGVLFLLVVRTNNEACHVWVEQGALLVFLTALVAFSSGLLLYLSRSYGAGALNPHMYSALSFVAASGAFVQLVRMRARLPVLWTGAAIVTVALATAGHIGGVITHGSPMNKAPWKTGDAPMDKPMDDAADSDSPVFEEVVFPVLMEKCIHCHGPKRTRGGLSLASVGDMLQGGNSGAALVQGDPQASLMIQRIHLPVEHEHHMPPEYEYQLRDSEIELLEWWVASGADAKTGDVPQDIMAALATEPEPEI